MFLQKINYSELEGEPKYWKIRDLNFGPINLIVGLNATGKTRLISVISSLAKILMKELKVDANWEVDFKNLDNNEILNFTLQIKNNTVIKEEIAQGGKKLLERNEEKGLLWYFRDNKRIKIFPPQNELTLSIRRDTKEFLFFEELINWAGEFHGYPFTNARPNVIAIPTYPG
jgi:AAA15 family ATPase/GTPase